MKEFKLIYLDSEDNVLNTSTIQALKFKEAYSIRDRVFANCMINDCTKILVIKEY